jgi:hypothetical protein
MYQENKTENIKSGNESGEGEMAIALGKVEVTWVERLQRKTQHGGNMRGMRHEQL